MVRNRPGQAIGDWQKHPSRLASSRMGPLPSAARISGPLRLLGRRRGAQTASAVGPDAEEFLGSGSTAGVDDSETSPLKTELRKPLALGTPCPSEDGPAIASLRTLMSWNF
jgi:hypothetical protein